MVVAFGKDELAAMDAIALGDKVRCPECSGEHAVSGGEALQFVRCNENVYLVGVNGRFVGKEDGFEKIADGKG